MRRMKQNKPKTKSQDKITEKTYLTDTGKIDVIFELYLFTQSHHNLRIYLNQSQIKP